MQVLIVYFSRSGHTRMVAEELKKELQCDAEELVDTANRSGPIGWLRSGRQAMSRGLTTLQPTRKDPSKYDVVAIGTPVWAGNMSTPVRTYIAENKGKIEKVAFFCTEGNRGDENTFKEMEGLCGNKPEASLVVKVAELNAGTYVAAVKKFAGEIKTVKVA